MIDVVPRGLEEKYDMTGYRVPYAIGMNSQEEVVAVYYTEEAFRAYSETATVATITFPSGDQPLTVKEQVAVGDSDSCTCGATVARTSHSHWCDKRSP